MHVFHVHQQPLLHVEIQAVVVRYFRGSPLVGFLCRGIGGRGRDFCGGGVNGKIVFLPESIELFVHFSVLGIGSGEGFLSVFRQGGGRDGSQVFFPLGRFFRSQGANDVRRRLEGGFKHGVQLLGQRLDDVGGDVGCAEGKASGQSQHGENSDHGKVAVTC